MRPSFLSSFTDIRLLYVVELSCLLISHEVQLNVYAGMLVALTTVGGRDRLLGLVTSLKYVRQVSLLLLFSQSSLVTFTLYVTLTSVVTLVTYESFTGWGVTLSDCA